MAIFEFPVTIRIETGDTQEAQGIVDGFMSYGMQVSNDDGSILSYTVGAGIKCGESAAVCKVCGSPLNGENCSDETCPYSALCKKCDSPLDGEYCSDERCQYSELPQTVPLEEVQNQSFIELLKRLGIARRIRIHAEIRSNDHHIGVDFDAGAWFAQADDDAIFDLHESGWSGDNAADTVALFYERRDKSIGKIMALGHRTQGFSKSIGFVCSVNKENAMSWLKQKRPGLWAQLLCKDNDVRLSEAQEEEIKGMWDWLDTQGNACECSFETIEDAALNAVAVLNLAS